MTPDVVVVGGGVIGLTVAWRAAGAGLAVTVVDPAAGDAAAYAAAGMLAPATEAHYTERALLALTRDSAARYPGFAADLEAATGQQVGFAECGTVVAGFDASDLAVLRDLFGFQQDLGLDVEWATGSRLRAAEPALAPGVPGGVIARTDHQVDPDRLLPALQAAAAGAGVVPVKGRVSAVTASGERATGVQLETGEELAAGQVVLAAGAWSGRIGLPPAAFAGRPLPVRPVKGQTLRLRGEANLLRHVVRGLVRGRWFYVVPRGDGRIVIGASVEEAGYDTTPRTGPVYELLRDAQALVPGLLETRWVEVRTGLRPGSPDNAPLIGPTLLDGLFVASGHFRNGVLLAPVTGDAVAAMLTGGTPPATVAPFAATRILEG